VIREVVVERGFGSSRLRDLVEKGENKVE